MENSKKDYFSAINMHICSIGRNLNLERTFRDNKIKKKIQFREATPHSSEKDVYAG